jgi:hypothetical protein
MKRLIGFFLAAMLAFAACTEWNDSRTYSKNSRQFLFFKTLSGKTPLLDPDRQIPMVSTTVFTVTNRTLMPKIYSLSRKNPSEWQEMTKEALVGAARQLADKEAETRLLLIAAGHAKIGIPRDSVENRLKPFFRKPGGKDAFIKELGEYGLTLKLVKTDIRNRMVIDRLVREVIYQNTSVSDNDLKKAYSLERYARVRQISMKIYGKSAAEIEAVEAKMNEVLLQIRGKADFAKLAETYSEDESTRKNGGLIEMSRYLLLDLFESVIFTLPEGKVSPVLRTQDWMTVIKVEQRSREKRPFDQAADLLRSELEQRKMRIAYTAYVDSLKKLYRYQDLSSLF